MARLIQQSIADQFSYTIQIDRIKRTWKDDQRVSLKVGHWAMMTVY